MRGPGRPGYVVMPCSMVWLRSISRSRLLPNRLLQIHPSYGADPGNGLTDFVVGSGGPRRNPEIPGVSQPAWSDRLRFGADWLVPNGAGGDVEPFRVLDVIRGYSVLIHQRGEMAGVTGIIASHHDHEIERLFQQGQHGILSLLGGRADGVEGPEMLLDFLRAVPPGHAFPHLVGDRERLSGQHRGLIGQSDPRQVTLEVKAW